MQNPNPSSRVIVRYAFFQVPGTVIVLSILLMLHWYVDLPMWSVCSTVALWVIKDVIMFPVVWRSYDADGSELAVSLIGSKGIAVEPLSPSGYIKVRGELWRAEIIDGCGLVDKGDSVRVRGSQGLTLLVQEEEEARG